MPLAHLVDITRPYTPTMAWAYDTLIARAVDRLVAGLVEEVAAVVPQGGSVLDVGCGGGQVLLSLARRRPDLALHGVDLSSDQVCRARGRLRASPHPCHIVQGSALNLPFDSECMAHVLSVASLKHWPDRAQGITECIRVLKPTGGLSIVEVDRGCSNHTSRNFIADWPTPRLTRPLALAMFRTWVAGPSVDLEDARQLVAPLDDPKLTVERLETTPMLVIRRR